MYKFIIVNDETNEVKHITSLIKEKTDFLPEIKSFSKLNKELKQEINNLDTPKVYILNIELTDNTSGITIAKSIRKVDYDSEIIFITKHDKMFEYAHRSIHKIFDYIEKFHDFDNRLTKDIHEIILRKYDRKMFHYEGPDELQIFFKSILYITRDTEERKLIIKTNATSYKINMTIKEIIKLLDTRFEQCHRSCIINNDHVEEKNYKEGYFLLDNGTKIYMLSKNFKKIKS